MQQSRVVNGVLFRASTMPVKSFRIDDLLNYDNNRNDVIDIVNDSYKKNQSVSSECESHNSDHLPSEPTDLTTGRKATEDGALNNGKSSSPSFQSEEVPLPIYIRSDANFYGSWPPKRRIRTVFTVQQINQLEKKFQTQHYLSPSERIDVARHLNLTVLQVKTWFQNRRMKWKKSCNESPTP